MRVLIVGDTVGKPGRQACLKIIPRLRESERLDCVIVNGENIAGGSSITADTIRELFESGAHVITSGDHIYRKKDSIELLEQNPRILKPLNYPPGTPGKGSVVVELADKSKIAVINLMGRVFLKSIDCPFRAVEKELDRLRKETPNIIVDLHAEATSEKWAMGWFLDGKVSAVVGTHTHVQTADEQILPNGTAYITDLGMCGPHKSVIGRKIEDVLTHFITQMPPHLEVASEDVRLSGVVIDVDSASGRAKSIKRIHEKLI